MYTYRLRTPRKRRRSKTKWKRSVKKIYKISLKRISISGGRGIMRKRRVGVII